MTSTQLVYVTIGSNSTGTGHIHRCGLLCNLLMDKGHKVSVLYPKTEELVASLLHERYQINGVSIEALSAEHILSLQPTLVLLDVLDTSEEFVRELKSHCPVITFEDLGGGAKLADLVINALYPEKFPYPNHYYGHRYVDVRQEFLDSSYHVRSAVGNVLLTFGGSDPSRLTAKTLRSIIKYCQTNAIEIDIITGIGFRSPDVLDEFPNVRVHTNVSNMAEFMEKADVAFSSAGRTIYELAAVGVPSIILCQNDRETTHLFASEENGFVNLGLGADLDESKILDTFTAIVESERNRTHMNRLMKQADLQKGATRIIELIENVK